MKTKTALSNVVRSGFPNTWGRFSGRTNSLEQRSQKMGASKNMGTVFLKKKKRLRQRTHKTSWGLLKIWGPFSGKESACGNVPRSSGLVKNMGAIFLEKKKRLRQRAQKLRACKNMGAIFLKKKAPAAT